MWGRSSRDDLEDYRSGANVPDFAELNANVRFYRNEIGASPSHETISDILREWRGDYRRLEASHTYIQWLFPIHTEGVNMSAQVLQKHEAETMRGDAVVTQRYVEAYDMMLDFYGMVLLDEETGRVESAPNWRGRLANLVRHPHNFLRVTRILKSLGLMGKEHFKPPLLEHFTRMLAEPRSRSLAVRYARSLTEFWIPTVVDDGERARLLRAAQIASRGERAPTRSSSQPTGAAAATGASAAKRTRTLGALSRAEEPGLATGPPLPRGVGGARGARREDDDGDDTGWARAAEERGGANAAGAAGRGWADVVPRGAPSPGLPSGGVGTHLDLDREAGVEGEEAEEGVREWGADEDGEDDRIGGKGEEVGKAAEEDGEDREDEGGGGG